MGIFLSESEFHPLSISRYSIDPPIARSNGFFGVKTNL